jgi:hypothetical protein
LAVVAARFGGAMPEPDSPGPLWLDAMLAFVKLSVDAIVVNAWGRHRRRRAGESEGAQAPSRQDDTSYGEQQKGKR